MKLLPFNPLPLPPTVAAALALTLTLTLTLSRIPPLPLTPIYVAPPPPPLSPLILTLACFDKTELPTRRNVAAYISIRPNLFLYAGQDVKDTKNWFGANEARGVADAYAAVTALAIGDENERIPLWDTVKKVKITGRGE